MTRSVLAPLVIDDGGDVRVELIMHPGDDGPCLLVTKYRIDDDGFRLPGEPRITQAKVMLTPEVVLRVDTWLMRFLHGVQPAPDKV